MMSKLLGYLSRVWNASPKDFSALVLGQGSSLNTLVTVGTQYLTFHSVTFRDDMPVKQALLLDSYTLDELVAEINSLGYTASLTQSATDLGYGSRKAYTLMPVENVPIENSTLNAFTAPLWQLLYPMARILEELNDDSDKAIAQMYVSSITDRWMDYWATFFKIKRLTGESDIQLQKRIFLSLMNMKTNNIALQELLKYSTNGSAVVSDYAPAEFEVYIDPQYMGTVDMVRKIIADAKGAGIDYFLNYLGTEEEDYKSYFLDITGIDFIQSDALSSLVSSNFTEHIYGYEQDRLKMFRTGHTRLRTEGLKILPKTIQDRGLDVILQPHGENYILPIEHANSTLTMPTDAYPLPSEVITARKVGLSDSYADPVIQGLVGFKTNLSKSFSSSDTSAMAKLAHIEQRAQESLTMTLTVGGVVVKSM